MVQNPVSSKGCVPLDDDTVRGTLAAAIEILEQGETLLQRVSSSEYTFAHTCAFSATIGEHYRHCLDHFSCFLGGVGSGVINYDARRRDPAVESDREAALAATCQLKNRLSELEAGLLRRDCRAVCKVSYVDDGSPECGSSFPRELAYVIAHAIHHYALVAIMCSVAGIRLPEGFGVAPSTLAHQAAG